MTLADARHIFCIGIGGIGISGLAKIFFAQGKKVSGVDAARSEITDELESMGISVVTNGTPNAFPPDADFVVYSEAVPFPHPLRRLIRERDIPEFSGSQTLAWLTKNKFTIAVAGTNGKSTTTAMLGLMLTAAGKDPTIFVGSRIKMLPMKNVRLGIGDLFVLEADEYQEKFLAYHPNVVVITNVEADHMETYRGFQHLLETFDKLLAKVKHDGFAVMNKDDAGCQKLHASGNAITYTIGSGAQFCAASVRTVGQKQIFEIIGPQNESYGEFTLHIPGAFNVSNALAAAACAFSLGVDAETVRKTLAEFGGLWRRFEVLGTLGNASSAPIVISDYGHHPTAIRKTVAAAREFYPGSRIVLAYQPHQRHRTRALFDDFVNVLPSADLVMVSDIYDVEGRDDETKTISSKDLVSAIGKSHVAYTGDLASTEAAVRAVARPGDVILVMGAGTIDEIARKLVIGNS